MHIDEWLNKLAEEEQEKQAALELEALFDHLPLEDVVKLAAEEKHSVKPDWIAGQKALVRATRAGDKGFSKYRVSNELAKKRLKGMAGGASLGATGGATLGLLAGGKKGGSLGAIAGALAGSSIGRARADKKHLKDKGIKQRWGGLASPHMTQSAAKKYLKEDEGRKKVAFVTQVARQVANEHANLEKEAKIFGERMPSHEMATGEIPYKQREAAYRRYVKDKAGEEPTSWGKALGGGALVGGALGGLAGASEGRGLRGAAVGIPVGALGGAGVGAAMRQIDKAEIDRVRDLSKRRGAIGRDMGRQVSKEKARQQQAKTNRRERRHQEMVDAIRDLKKESSASPYAQQTAHVMKTAMKASLGAPLNIRRSAIKLAAKSMRQAD